MPGDNDPVDFVDVCAGSDAAPRPAPTGTVYRAKVLGALGVLDDAGTTLLTDTPRGCSCGRDACILV